MDCAKDNCSGIGYHIPYEERFENMTLITEGDKYISGMMCNEFCDERTEYQEGRSLSAMVSIITEAIKALSTNIQELVDRITLLETENQLIKSELCLKDSSYKFCEVIK